MKETINFLEKSIADIQATIRAVDVKSGFIIAILFTPLYGFDKLNSLFGGIYHESTFHSILIILVTILWAISIYTTLMAISAISNPAKHVSGPGATYRGSFYGADLFSLNILDTFWNIRSTSTRTIDQEIATLPQDEQSIIKELTYEKIKLTYIREIKLNRIKFSARATLVWLCLSLATYILHLRG